MDKPSLPCSFVSLYCFQIFYYKYHVCSNVYYFITCFMMNCFAEFFFSSLFFYCCCFGQAALKSFSLNQALVYMKINVQ